MNSNTTLGEVKERCIEMTGKYGDKCCDNCDIQFGCCEPPDAWKLEKPVTAQPNWEELFNKARAEGAKMFEEREYLRAKVEHLEQENKKLRLILSTVETMLGRKFDKC